MRKNLQICAGNLAADSIVRPVSDDRDCLSFRVITSDTWTDRTSGESKEKTCAHDVVQFGKKGQFDRLSEMLKKGAGVYVEGRTEKEMRQTEDGKDYLNVTVNASFGFGEIQITKYVTEKPAQAAPAQSAPAQSAPAQSAPAQAAPEIDDKDDIPF